MTLDEMKAIADARTKGKWENLEIHFEDKGLASMGPIIEDEYSDEAHFSLDCMKQAERDSQFIAMAANNWDKLMDVVEAAKFLDDNLGHWFLARDASELKIAWREMEIALEELDRQ